MRTAITLDWTGGERFVARDEDDNQISLGGSQADPPALRPMHTVLAALAGCAAIGVRRILEKQRMDFDTLRFEVHGDREPAPPATFTHIYVTVTVEGRHLDPDRVERAVRLTEEKYCSVYALLSAAVPIETRVVVVDHEA